MSLLGRLALLVPWPRVKLMLYYEPLGARLAWRAAVVSGAPPGEGDVAEGAGSDAAAATELPAADPKGNISDLQELSWTSRDDAR